MDCITKDFDAVLDLASSSSSLNNSCTISRNWWKYKCFSPLGKRSNSNAECLSSL